MSKKNKNIILVFIWIVLMLFFGIFIKNDILSTVLVAIVFLAGVIKAVYDKSKKAFKIMLIIFAVLFASAFAWAGLTKAGYIPNFLDIEILCSGKNNTPQGKYYNAGDNYSDVPALLKPVIYLYPQQKQEIAVQLNYQGKIIADYPEYNNFINGWKVTAYPDGRIINSEDNQEYNYLFWEGISDTPVDWDFSKGFCVKGEDTREFLQRTLASIGLTPKEYNEFIVYWYPKMQDNAYNLIHFAGKQYTETAPLAITPNPDSILRVFMVFKPMGEKKEIDPQIFTKFQREGFSVIEWGGMEIQ